MKIQTNLLHLLRIFSLKKNEAQVSLDSFQEYLRRYSKHYLHQKQELSKYLTISHDDLIKELKKLQTEGSIELISDTANNINIFIPHFYIDSVSRQYTEIEAKPEIPFPLLTDLPRSFPGRLLKQILVSDDFASLKTTPDGKDFLFALNYNGDVPSLLFPGTFTTDRILNFALSKIKLFLSKDDSRDYVQKKLFSANPSKELTVRSFIAQIAAQNANSFQSAKNSNETYIMWGQFCTFVKQEFSKKNERLPDEIALLQSVGIIEYLNNFYRNSAQKDLQSETALKNLMLALQRPPYYFSMKQISAFKDSRGIPLLGQYTEKRLQEFMKEKTTMAESYSIPDILTFTNSSGERFYVLAEKIIPLLVYLINESRKPVREICIKKWQSILLNFEHDNSMKNEAAFSAFLKNIIAENAPDLYSLLHAPFFIYIISNPRLNEVQAEEMSRIFPDGKLALYQEVLMLDRSELLKDTKILLPFWYTIPIIYAIVAFFKRSRKKPEKKEEEKKERPSAAQRSSLKDSSEKMIKALVPPNMTLDEILERKLDAWNQNLNQTMRNNLTEDINAFIRDYLKGIQKTLSASSLTEDRLKTIARTLADTPSLQKIKNRSALQSYIELYLLKLILKYF